MKTLHLLFYIFNRISGTLFPSWTAKRVQTLFVTPRRFEPPDWELDAELAGERYDLTPDISAVRWRPVLNASSKQKVLLAHGWEGRATQLSGFVPALLNEGYEVISLDMPAHGRSKGRRADARLFSDALLAANAKEGPFHMVIAHSMGAPATALAVSQGLQTKGLVLLSSPSRIDILLKQFAKTIGLNDQSSHHFVRHMSDYVGLDAKKVDLPLLLSPHNIPILLIHDNEDKDVPIFHMHRMRDGIKHAELYETSGLGHRRILRDPATINKVVDFIRDKERLEKTPFAAIA